MGWRLMLRVGNGLEQTHAAFTRTFTQREFVPDRGWHMDFFITIKDTNRNIDDKSGVLHSPSSDVHLVHVVFFLTRTEFRNVKNLE